MNDKKEEIIIGENCFIDCEKCKECGDIKHCEGVLEDSYNDWASQQNNDWASQRR